MSWEIECWSSTSQSFRWGLEELEERLPYDHRDRKTSIKGYQSAGYAKQKSRDFEGNIKRVGRETAGDAAFHAHASPARDDVRPRKNQFTPVQCGRTGTLLYLTTTVTVIELAELIVVRPNRSPLGQFAVLEFGRSFDILEIFLGIRPNAECLPGISAPRREEEREDVERHAVGRWSELLRRFIPK